MTRGHRPQPRPADGDRQGRCRCSCCCPRSPCSWPSGWSSTAGRSCAPPSAPTTTAAEAARAGVQSVQPASVVRGQAPRVNRQPPSIAAQHYLAAAGVTGTVDVIGDRIQVRTSISFTPAFLSLIGLGEQQTVGRADARLARGVDQEQP